MRESGRYREVAVSVAWENSHPSLLPAEWPFVRNATWAGSKEGQLFSQATVSGGLTVVSNDHLIVLKAFYHHFQGRLGISCKK